MQKIKIGSIIIIGIILGLSHHSIEAANGRDKSIEVNQADKTNFPYAWAGGMNSCQYNEIDMNLDGIMDLLVFDRVGNRLIPFINGGQPGTIDYTYAPEYIHLFPQFYSWVIFKDYDADGRMDIFTYSKDFPGMIVYKNISQEELKFELVAYPFLTSFQGGGEVNILVTDVDYPAIVDIDGDGDLDILTFWGLGSFVQYHQNQSMEMYGIPDSLIYIEVTRCWGHFAENEEGNEIYLDTCQYTSNSKLDSLQYIRGKDGLRHTGSTFLMLDLDGDQDLDLLLGDVDYPNLIALINEPMDGEDHIIEQHPDFPIGDTAVRLFAMPAAAYLDVNNDGLRDLLVSPFDPSLISSENHESSWLYLNSGTNSTPEFHLFEKSFLQDKMIDVGAGAYPVLADYNGDGLQDLFISNYGYYMYSSYLPGNLLNSVFWSNIALFENTGTAAQPKFNAVSYDFAKLHVLHYTALYPTFGDVDGDGDQDMICGKKDGSLIFLENMAGAGNPMEFADPVNNYFDIQVGNFSTPQLFDLDQDGRLDLIVGEEQGTLNYYHNAGTATDPDFILENDFLGNVNVTDPALSYYGFSTPDFFYDPEGNTKLIVGSEQGELFYFTNIDGNLGAAFTPSNDLPLLTGVNPDEYKRGIRIGAAIDDMNADDFYELIVGNYSGGLHFYQVGEAPQVDFVDEPTIDGFHLFPNPAADHLLIQLSDAHAFRSFQIKIYSAEGKLMMEQNVKDCSKTTIDISRWEAGIYFCSVNWGQNIKSYFIQKFIKQ